MGGCVCQKPDSSFKFTFFKQYIRVQWRLNVGDLLQEVLRWNPDCTILRCKFFCLLLFIANFRNRIKVARRERKKIEISQKLHFTSRTRTKEDSKKNWRCRSARKSGGPDRGPIEPPPLSLLSLPSLPLEIRPQKIQLGVWGSAISSHSGVWGGVQA